MSLQTELLKAREAVRRVGRGFTPGQKAVTAVAVVALVVGAVLLSRQLGTPTYGVLYSNLRASDAASVTAKLQASKIPYQLANGGQTILVPRSQVYQERIDLAQAGLPAGGNVGLSLLDKEGITTSQFTQQADYQRALQGELASTIEAIHGVQGAQIDLALPTTNVFSLSSQGTTTASVMVDLAPGTVLTQGQVQAIVHLVASAVPNLSATNVTVVDQSGNVLAAPGLSNGAGNQQGAVQLYDSSVQAAIQSMLQQVVGAGKVAVVVHAQLNFDKVSTTSQLLQTNAKGVPVTAPTQTKSQKQTFNGAGAGAGGVLGAAKAAAAPAAQNGNYSNLSTSTSYALGKVTQTVDKAPGSVQRMSVAVLLDSRAGTVSMPVVRQLVTAAAGLQPKRGDTLSVARLPFSIAAAQAAKAQAAAQAGALRSARLISLAKTGALLLLAVIAVLFLLRSARRPQRTELALAPEPWPLETERFPTAELPAPAQGAVDELIEEQPDQVARLLRSWMTEREQV